MTYDECKELLATIMEAVVKQVDARLSGAVKFEVGVVRLVDDDNVYVRPSSDVSTPTYDSPTSTAQLDDGDIVMPNISGLTLEAGDGVEILYTTTVDNAVIARRLIYAPVPSGGGGGGGSSAEPSNATPQMDGTASAGTSSKFSRGDHVHPSDTTRAPINSPALTGTPTAPTPTSSANNTQIATTAFVQTLLAALSLVPSTGQTGNVLTKTSGGYDWQALPIYDGSVT